MRADIIPAIEIPAGEVIIRDARRGTSRTIRLRPFAIGRTPITAGEFRSVRLPATTENGTRTAESSDLPEHPVTWFEAVRWCNEASASQLLDPAYRIAERVVEWDPAADGWRLPTEAEWEWACRAGTAGPTYGPLEHIAWTDADHVEGPQPVASKVPNPFGVFDMIGNVWEWCWDYADTGRYADYRSLRGGGWADPAWSCRASVRRGSAPDALIEDVGFRVARGTVGAPGTRAAQGWSRDADESRARMLGPLPVGWTPLREES